MEMVEKMKKLLAALLIAVPAIAHVPVITPSEIPKGDAPPKLEDEPLPAVIMQMPMPGIVLVLSSYKCQLDMKPVLQSNPMFSENQNHGEMR